jgi:Bifunctional DNA primase/polymerase, N-terminal
MISVPETSASHLPTCDKDVAARIGTAPDSLGTLAGELALAPNPHSHLASGPQRVSAQQVREFRNHALDNGYPLIRVKTKSKAPLAAGWQHGETRESLSDVRESALNTGVLLGGLRCVDLDIDDAQVTLEVMGQARCHLPPGALLRRRAGSPRLSLFYRSETGQPTKRAINGAKGKVEILGHGQQAVVHGQHPSGASITWRDGRGPDTVPLDQVPKVSEAQISAFLDACAPVLQPHFVGSNDHEPYKGKEKVLPLLVVSEIEIPAPSANVLAKFKHIPLENLGAGIESQYLPIKLIDIGKECAFAGDAIATNGATYTEPMWNITTLIATFTEGGRADAHLMASGHAGYSREETDAKYDRKVREKAEKSLGWPKCTTITAEGCTACQSCKHFNKGKTPLHFARSSIAFVPEIPANDNSSNPLRFTSLPVKEAVERINREFFVLQRSGKIYQYDSEGELRAVPKQDFKTALGGRWVTFDDNGEVKRRAAADAWLDDPERREYRGIQYCPNYVGLRSNHLNLWAGWGEVVPEEGECSIVIDHILKIVADGDQTKCDFLLDWVADILQNPTRKPGVALVLRGGQGSGKTVVPATVRTIVGPKNVLVVNDKDRLLGRFNSSVMNKIACRRGNAFCRRSCNNRQTETSCHRSDPSGRVQVWRRN